MNKKFFYVLILLLSIISNAAAQSTMTLTGTAPQPLYIEEVSSQNILSSKLTINRTNTSKSEYYTIDLSPISTVRQTWEYNYTQGVQVVHQANIYTNSNTNQTNYIAKKWGIEQNLATGNVWSGMIFQGQSQKQITYYLQFQDWTTTPPPYGTYQLDLEFRLWPVKFVNNSSPPTNVTPIILPITLTVIIGPYIYISFADKNGLPMNTIALDETSVKTVEFKILAKANLPFDVTISSTNGGSLNLNTGTTIEKINYSLWVKDLTTPINFQQTPIKTILSNINSMGYSVPPISEPAIIQVLFDSDASYTVGRYSDVLHLVIKSHW